MSKGNSMFIPSSWSRHPRGKLQPGSSEGQDKLLADRFAGPRKNQGIFRVGRIDESGGERDGADPGVELEKEAEQGGTRRDVFSKSRLLALKKHNIAPFQGARLTTIFIISNSSRGSTPLIFSSISHLPPSILPRCIYLVNRGKKSR